MTLQAKLIKLEQRVQAKDDRLHPRDDPRVKALVLILELYAREFRHEAFAPVPVFLKVTRNDIDMLVKELFGDAATRSDENKEVSQKFIDDAIAVIDEADAWLD